VAYRPYRDYWIALLLTVNDKIFALPVPKVIPSKVKAQYEIEDDYREQQKTFKALGSSFKKIKRRATDYLRVSDIFTPSFQRCTTRLEAGIEHQKESTVVPVTEP
jgi:uncharacterized protein (DUF736 family)